MAGFRTSTYGRSAASTPKRRSGKRIKATKAGLKMALERNRRRR